MKKTLRIALICIFVLVLAAGVAVAGQSLFGIKVNNGTAQNVTLTPVTYFDQNASSGQVGGTASVYQDAEKIEVTYTDATEGSLYMIYVLKAEDGVAAVDARPSEDNIVYINAATATAAGVTFTIYQSELDPEDTYNIYLASNSTSGTEIGAISLVGSYQYIEAGTGDDAGLLGRIKGRIGEIRGKSFFNGQATANDPYDVNGDGYVNESDVSELLDDTEE